MSRQLREGDVLGSYRIVKLLATGGNADVYVAEIAGTPCVALKVLRARARESEPYRRFLQEVKKHYELSQRGVEGVLPLLEFDVPAVPSATRPAWMAMPIAEPIEAALGDNPKLEIVAQALGDVAATLARLHEENVAHRDVKPGNLYRYSGAWVISDFGLVAIPEGDSLTVGTKALGPRNFIAPEMLLRPDVADGRPADVYSLGKTLWCLLTGQRIPPPAEHRRELEWKKLSHWGVSHPRAFYLDRLIEQTCREIPSERPRMAVLKDTLRNWASPAESSSTSGDPDVRDLAAEIVDIFAGDNAQRDRQRQRHDDIEGVVDRLAVCLRPLSDQLSSATRVTSDHQVVSEALMGFADSIPGADRIAAWRSIAVDRNTGRDGRHALLKSGVSAALATDQSVVVAAVHAIRHAGGLEVVWKDASAPVLLDSQALEIEMKRISDGFVSSIPNALARFLEVVRKPQK